MRSLQVLLIAVLVTGVALPRAFAWVDIKNANLAITRADVKVEGVGPDLVLERTYNSRSLHDGLFGHGWCSNVESTLTLVAKGLAVYQECGAGRAKIFKSSSFSQAEDDAAIEKLMQLVREAKGTDAKVPNNFKSLLKGDIEIRAAFVRNYGMTVASIEGERFVMSNFPEPSEVKNEKGRFVMRDDNGTSLGFEASGALSRVFDRFGHEIRIEWSKGLPQTIVDSQKRRIVLLTNADGRISEVRAPGGRNLKYKYSGQGDLSLVEGAGGSEKYEYDSAHNLADFRWGRVSVKAKYDSKEDRVTEVTTPDCTSRYKYDLKRDGRRLSVELDSKCSNRPREQVKYDFQFKETKSGSVYEAEMTATDAAKNETSIRYSDDNRPVWMKRAGAVTEFSYDEKGRLQTVTSPKGVARYRYDEAGRISVYSTTKPKSNSTREIRYTYSPNGTLKSARDGAIETNFAYDAQGRLSAVSNSRGKSVEISHRGPASEVFSSMKATGVGKIDLTYDPNGKLVPPRDDQALARFITVMTSFEDLSEPAAEVWRKGGGR